jgi:DNA ligase-1
VFDAPDVAGGFEDRLRVLHDVLADTTAPAFVLEHQRCTGRDELAAVLSRVVRGGGEGVMIRQPDSPYEPKRSGSLLKVKPLHDAEALVIGHEPGTGRNRSTIGALVARLPSGVVFRISSGLTDVVRRSPPAVGSVVTFSHHDYTDGGVPRFPAFVRGRGCMMQPRSS